MKDFSLFLTTLCLLLAACTSTPVSDPTVTVRTSTVPTETAQPTSTLAPTLVSNAPLTETPMTIAATKTIPPTPSASYIRNPDQAIAYSYDLLLKRGLEKGFSYDNANYVQVEFPSGDAGVFIAIGFSGPTRGYQFLYRIRGDQVELIELIPGGIDWGIRSLRDFNKVGIEILQLFPGTSGQSSQVLKVTGSGHAGTGLWSNGYFELISIADDGIRVVFAGAEVEINAHHQGWYREYQYQYDDLDTDGYSEIIQEGEECRYQGSDEGLEKIDCQRVKKVYYFDGAEYVEQK
jgi:hypothetical protein